MRGGHSTSPVDFTCSIVSASAVDIFINYLKSIHWDVILADWKSRDDAELSYEHFSRLYEAKIILIYPSHCICQENV